MYGLPLDTDFEFMVGAQLIQVGIGENEVILHFEPPTSITIAGEARLTIDGRLAEQFAGATVIGTALVPLLGDSIREASAHPGGLLRIAWTAGAILELLDSWDRYESYTVTCGDRVIVV